MKKFMCLQFEFEKPTPEIMEEWKAWFASIAGCQVDQGGIAGGKEIGHGGTRDLPWDADCIAGSNRIEAESLDAAGEFAARNPFIKAIRIYELRQR